MGLDIHSERGRATLAQELRAVEIVQSVWPYCEYYHTAKEGSASVDAIIVRPPVVHAVAETKCREMSLHTLQNSFKNEWLVTADKIDRGVAVAELLQVEFWGFLYLVPDDIVLRVKIWHPDAKWLVKMRREHTETQRTVNGGKAVRLNAFIDMATAHILRSRG